MKILTVANQKGGVGKTAFIVEFAFYLQSKGYRVAVLDYDIQANASYTLSAYDSGLEYIKFLTGEYSAEQINADKPGITLFSAHPSLVNLDTFSIQDVVESLFAFLNVLADKDFDYVLIDTPPSLGIRLSAVLCVSGYVLSPIELEAYSLQGISQMVHTIYNIRKTANKGLVFLGMLPSRVDNRNPRHKRHLQELNAKYPALVVPHSLALRSSFADSLATKRSIWDIKKTAARVAAREFDAVASYILEQMN